MKICTFRNALVDINSQPLTVEDVAISLSRTFRYCGFTAYPYSVLWHSIVVGFLMMERTKQREALFVGLTHDVGETISRDIASPIKDEHCSSLEFFEDTVRQTFIYGLNWEDFGLASKDVVGRITDLTQKYEGDLHVVDKTIVRRAEMRLLFPPAARMAINNDLGAEQGAVLECLYPIIGAVDAPGVSEEYAHAIEYSRYDIDNGLSIQHCAFPLDGIAMLRCLLSLSMEWVVNPKGDTVPTVEDILSSALKPFMNKPLPEESNAK